MPKIIKNVRENIISSTKEIILEKGFNALTMRDVAKKTGYGVGTIYNYFPNKMSILAAILLGEWSLEGRKIEEKIQKSPTFPTSIEEIYSSIKVFFQSHKDLFFSVQIPFEIRSKIHFGHDAFLRNIEKYVLEAQKKFSIDSNDKDRYVACLLLIQAASTYELPFEEINEPLIKLLIGGK